MRRDDYTKSILLGLGLGAGIGLGAVMADMIAKAVKGGAQMTCPACASQVPIGSKFCSNCGVRIEATVCPECQAALPAGSKFCNQCGTKIE